MYSKKKTVDTLSTLKGSISLAQKIRAVIGACIFVSVLGIPAFGFAATYATWNPGDAGPNITLSGGDLTMTQSSSGWTSVRSTIGVSSGKYYWELKVNGPIPGSPTGIDLLEGVGNASMPLTSWVGNNTDGYGWYFGGAKYNGGSSPYCVSGGGGGYQTDDVIGVALDADNGTIKMYRNGVDCGSDMYTGMPATTYYAAASTDNNASGFTANFGASPFVYTPPTGYIAGLCTGCSGPGPGPGPSVTYNVPAVQYSQASLITSPATLVSVAPATDAALKQSGLVFLVHSASTSPTVTWGGANMLFFASTTNASGYLESMYWISHPGSGNIVVANVTTSDLVFESASVWSYADILTVFNTYTSVTGSSRAFLNMGSAFPNSSTVVAGMLADVAFSSYVAQPGTSILQSASGTPNFALVSATCSPLASCPVGWTTSVFGAPGISSLIGIGMYATSSSPLVATSSPSQYADCDTTDLICHLSNTLIFVFVPDPATVDKFKSITFASSSPFSYAYQIPQIFDDVFNSATSSTLGWTMDLGLSSLTGTSSTITIIGPTTFSTWPFVATIRMFIGYALWLGLAYSLYLMAQSIFNKEQK